LGYFSKIYAKQLFINYLTDFNVRVIPHAGSYVYFNSLLNPSTLSKKFKIALADLKYKALLYRRLQKAKQAIIK